MRPGDVPLRVVKWAAGVAVLMGVTAFALGVEAYVRWGRL
jgi:hypothetical protein